MKSLDLKKLFETYTGLWVALTVDHHVITAHKSAKETYDEALKKGYSDPILFKVPTKTCLSLAALYNHSHVFLSLR